MASAEFRMAVCMVWMMDGVARQVPLHFTQLLMVCSRSQI